METRHPAIDYQFHFFFEKTSFILNDRLPRSHTKKLTVYHRPKAHRPSRNRTQLGMGQARTHLVTRRERNGSKTARELSDCDSINGRRPPLVFFLLVQAAPPALACPCKGLAARERPALPLPLPLSGLGKASSCLDRHGEDDDDAAAGLRAGVAGAAQLRRLCPLRPG